MIRSMTGFGKGESKGRRGRFTVEIRTVNHKYFDVSSRMQNSFNRLEERIKDYLHRYIRRGKVNFSLLYRQEGRAVNPVKVDDEAVEKHYRALARINSRFKLKDEIRLSHILSFPDVIVEEHPEHEAISMWPFIEQAIKRAVMECNRMKAKEGRAIFKDLSKRTERISVCVNKISSLVPGLVSGYKKRLESSLRHILKKGLYDIDRNRLETELAIFARQCDVSEEITRAKSHISALKNTFLSNEESGRRLEFILQELQREINTLGSKAGDVKISRLVVDIKSEIEKMREQAQNVE